MFPNISTTVCGWRGQLFEVDLQNKPLPGKKVLVQQYSHTSNCTVGPESSRRGG